MLKHRKYVIGRIFVFFFLICIGLSYTNTCYSAESEQNRYTLPVKYENSNIYLDVLKKENDWFIEVNSLANITNCIANIENDRITLIREKSDVVIYEENKDALTIVDGKIYVPLRKATVAAGAYFFEDSNSDLLAVKSLKVPIEFEKKMNDVFADNRVLLSRMQNDLGGIWTTAQTAARLYSIMPFVGSYSFVGTMTGENEIQQYEEGFGHILSNEGTVYEMLEAVSGFDKAITDSITTLELADQLTSQGGVLNEYAVNNGIDEQLIDNLVKQYPEGMNTSEVMEWLTSYSDATTAMNVKYILDSCALYSVSMDVEESMITALKEAFEFCGNYHAKVACEKIIERRCGLDMNNFKDLYKGWAIDTLSDFLSKNLEDILTGGGKSTELVTAALTRTIDYGFQASDKSNAILFYDIYTSIQNEMIRYFNQIPNVENENDQYKKRAATILYLKCAISAYENMKFDDSIKEAVENAQGIFEDYLLDILSFSEQEYLPDYDNQIVIDWLNTHEDSGILFSPQYLIEYLEMTVNDVAAVWGDDYTVIDTWFAGASKGIYYKDNRTTTKFYFHDPKHEGIKTGNEKINLIVETSGTNSMIKEGMPCQMTYRQLNSIEGVSSLIEDEEYGGVVCNYEISPSITASFNWNNGADPNTTYPSIMLYREGLEMDVSKVSSEDNAINTYEGIWHSTYIEDNYPMEELTIQNIDGDKIICNLSMYRLYQWENLEGYFISDNSVEINADMGAQYVNFLLTFETDFITMTVEETNSDYFDVGKQYVFCTRSDQEVL